MDNIGKILTAIARGFIDCLKGTLSLFYPNQNRSPQQKDGKSLQGAVLLISRNGAGFLITILLFENALLPSVRSAIQHYGENYPQLEYFYDITKLFLQIVFNALWVYPVYFLSKISNTFEFVTIAESAYRSTTGRPQVLPSIGKQIADFFFSSFIQLAFLIQTCLVGYFPIPPFGYFFSLVHTCMLFALYLFEYKMCNMGWELHKRLNFIETNWPYFIGFGMPLALLTTLASSYIISGCIFSTLFPLFIISANAAAPVTKSTTVRLPLFSLVIALSNAIFFKTMASSLAKKRAVTKRS